MGVSSIDYVIDSIFEEKTFSYVKSWFLVVCKDLGYDHLACQVLGRKNGYGLDSPFVSDSNSASGSHNKGNKLILIMVMVWILHLSQIPTLPQQKKKREQEQARFLKLFEDGDGIEYEVRLGIVICGMVLTRLSFVLYGVLFLSHITEDITDLPNFTDGVPKEGLRIQDVLVRIAVLLLIKDKEGNNLPSFSLHLLI
ncbi:hypothetical protein GH714_010169 [Hevea brasiliensis]|uniref:CHD subfamily II SANT-like domain-containing protein n=1 Tax=Hevea brasiliensis TaxID=3981 RepID=A0A6A6L793_HEVBR|nr:hypothetical protein GH714_010169 [Hevea brasiliensis]